MRISLSLLLTAMILLVFSNLIAQKNTELSENYPAGLSLEYGLGKYALTDEYISKEKYSGTLPSYGILWSNSHETYVYKIDFNFRNSSGIKNNNISTDIYQVNLNQSFLYPLPDFSVFGKTVKSFLGPSNEMFFFANDQNLAVSGFDYAQSYAMLISAGINSNFYCSLQNDLLIESSLNLNLFSFAFRMIDTEETDESPAKLLTFIKALKSSFKLGLRYHLNREFSCKVSYSFELLRVSSWNPLTSMSDNFIISLTYDFY